MDWGWPQIVFLIFMTLRTRAMMRDHAKNTSALDRRCGYVAVILIQATAAYILHVGGFW